MVISFVIKFSDMVLSCLKYCCINQRISKFSPPISCFSHFFCKYYNNGLKSLEELKETWKSQKRLGEVGNCIVAQGSINLKIICPTFSRKVYKCYFVTFTNHLSSLKSQVFANEVLLHNQFEVRTHS